MKLIVEFSYKELKEFYSITSMRLDVIEYAISEVEDTPEVRFKKHLLENILSKLDINYHNTNKDSMNITIEFSEDEVIEAKSIISTKLEGVEYAISEVEDDPGLQIKKYLLEKILSKLNTAYHSSNLKTNNTK